MTSRERMLAAIRGEEVDRFPVWLKMANPTWRLPQPESVRRLDEVELLTAAGCDRMMGCGFGCQTLQAHVSVKTREETGRKTTVYTTPDGELVEENTHDPYSDSWHPTRYPVQTAADLDRLRWLFRDNSVVLDEAGARHHRDHQAWIVSQDAVSLQCIGPGPLMSMVEQWCGPENATYLLHDHPEEFSECLALMHETRKRELQVICAASKADTLWLIENTSTTLISPAMFETHCVPHLRDYGNIILEHGLIPVHHMCGTLNALLELIDDLPALANEAYTTRPLGNVSLAEGRTRMPSKCLIGGTNATLWMSDPDTIIRAVAEDLANCPDRRRIFLTSAGVLTPLVSLEKARRVVDALKML